MNQTPGQPGITHPVTLRARPVEVQAMLYDTDNWDYVKAWLVAERQDFAQADTGHDLILAIETPQGHVECRPGYWIVKGTMGEIYPVHPEVIAAKYEAAA